MMQMGTVRAHNTRRRPGTSSSNHFRDRLDRPEDDFGWGHSYTSDFLFFVIFQRPVERV